MSPCLLACVFSALWIRKEKESGCSYIISSHVSYVLREREWRQGLYLEGGCALLFVAMSFSSSSSSCFVFSASSHAFGFPVAVRR